jgi:hypothetical protein
VKTFKISTIAATVALLACGAANAQLIANGSFETPVVNPGTFQLFVVGSSGLTGWSVIGPAGRDIANVNNFSQNGVTFAAQSGNQSLDLTGFNDNSTEGVAQTIATTIGDRYHLTFYVGNTTGGGIFGTTSTVDLLLNGGQVLAAVNSAVNTTGLTWQQFSFDFVATGASTALGFVNGDPGTDNSNFLDNVVLVDQGPVGAVPEPQTYALMLAGFSLIGLMAGRRRRQS